jgi:quercetin dioxygenase-like cupin family protein
MRELILSVVSLSVAFSGCGGGTSARCAEPVAAVEGDAAGGSRGAVSGAETPAAEVRAIESAERRASPPGTAEIAMLARGENAFLGRLVMEAGAEVPEHRDATEEYVHVLEGSGVITIDGQTYDVAPGSTIFMPANALVSFRNGAARMVAIQVFAGPEPAAKYDAWRPVDAGAAAATAGETSE